jgi:Protein of unknown function (DUF551)
MIHFTKAGWREISTAPKDTRILVTDTKPVCLNGYERECCHSCRCNVTPRVYIGKWLENGRWSVEKYYRPTHWMPLPLPPEVEA